jgi:hypothetical protein
VAKFEPDFRQFRRTIFVAAETRRLHEAEDSRIAQSLHRFGRHALGLFGCKRSFFDLRAEAAYARKNLRKVRADCRWSMNAHCFRMHVPFLRWPIPHSR